MEPSHRIVIDEGGMEEEEIVDSFTAAADDRENLKANCTAIDDKK